jgi:predicted nucleic acid-binding Zn ribbon protein
MAEDEQRVTLAARALAAAKEDARARGVGAPPAGALPAALDPIGDRRAGQAGIGPAADGTPQDPAGEPRVRGAEPHGRTVEPPPGAGQQGAASGSPTVTGGPAAPGLATGAARAAGPRRAAGRPRRDDPAPLSAAINSLITESGWSLAAATGSVFARWGQIVGPDLAAHTAPGSLEDGELTVTADSTAWATQVRLLAAELIRRLNSELGAGTVRRVRVLGPGAGSRKPGQWRVRGSRGPRDTYG